MGKLDLHTLQAAVSGNYAAFRCTTELQPAGGPGDKVFPPTYKDARYAFEKRRLPGRPDPVDCVLLDSVQSQANRMELALLDAWNRAGSSNPFPLPVITVEFPDSARGLRISSLEAPHRIADALLRDSEADDDKGGKIAFRTSPAGKALDQSSLANATPLFEHCPTALLFGLWDSTGAAGGLGVKFPRAIVSEVVGIDVERGVRTSSRIDPSQILKNAGKLFARDGEPRWTLDEAKAVHENNGEPVLYGGNDDKKKRGTPAAAILGNVTPTIGETGGVTLDHALQTTVLSLPSLRRLRFPIQGKSTDDVDIAARTVLAAMGICAATLVRESGCDLRSRCLLVPTAKYTWELLGSPCQPPATFEIDADSATEIYCDSIAAAQKLKLPWNEKPITLTPSPELLALVLRSQALLAASPGDATEEEG